MNTALRAPSPLPVDIRLMQSATAVLSVLLLSLLLGAALWWAVRLPVFSLSGISVQGDTVHNNALTLRANVAPRLTGNFFTINLNEARRVFESVPWVRQAVVRREFPNRLRVQLQEHQAVAYWGAEGDSRLVNSFGEIFEANAADAEQADLPRLVGSNADSAAVLQMSHALAPWVDKLDASLDQLELSARGAWRAQLDNGAVIELGSGSSEEVLQRMERFVQTLTPVAARYGRRAGADLQGADLRHKDGYALRLRGVTTVSAVPSPNK